MVSIPGDLMQGSRQLEQPRYSFSLKSGSPKHGANEGQSGPGLGKERAFAIGRGRGVLPKRDSWKVSAQVK